MTKESNLTIKKTERLFRVVVIAHSSYALLTAVWPLIDIQSFMLVTGRKTDVWLVKTVGAILISWSITMLSYLRFVNDRGPAIILGITGALAFIGIDFYYALTDVISDVYLVDGCIQMLFLIAWYYVALRNLKFKIHQ